MPVWPVPCVLLPAVRPYCDEVVAASGYINVMNTVNCMQIMHPLIIQMRRSKYFIAEKPHRAGWIVIQYFTPNRSASPISLSRHIHGVLEVPFQSTLTCFA